MRALTHILCAVLLAVLSASSALAENDDDGITTGQLNLAAFPDNLPKQIPCHLLPNAKYNQNKVSVRYEYPEPLRLHSLWQEGAGVNDKIYVFDGIDQRTYEASPGVRKQLNQRWYITYQVTRREDVIPFDDYLNSYQKEFPFVMADSYGPDEQAYVNKISFRIPMAKQRDDRPYAMLYTDVTQSGDSASFAVGGIRIVWEECRLSPLLTVRRTSRVMKPIHDPDDIWNFYHDKNNTDLLENDLANAESFLIAVKNFTPVVNGAFQLADCVTVNTFRCWFDAGLTTTGESLALLVPVRPLGDLAKLGLDPQKIAKISALAKRGLQGVAVVRAGEAAEAAVRREWLQAAGYLADGVITLASSADAIKLTDKPASPCKVNFSEAAEFATPSPPLKPKLLEPVRRWFNSTMLLKPLQVTRKMLDDAYQFLGVRSIQKLVKGKVTGQTVDTYLQGWDYTQDTIEGFSQYLPTELRIGKEIVDDSGNVFVVTGIQNWSFTAKKAGTDVLQTFSAPNSKEVMTDVVTMTIDIPGASIPHEIDVSVPRMDNGATDTASIALAKDVLESVPAKFLTSIRYLNVHTGQQGISTKIAFNEVKGHLDASSALAHGGRGLIEYFPNGLNQRMVARNLQAAAGAYAVKTPEPIAIVYHELAHCIQKARNMDEWRVPAGWGAARLEDNLRVTPYGEANLSEDFAETVMTYISSLSEHTDLHNVFRSKWPHRYAILDNLFGTLDNGILQSVMANAEDIALARNVFLLNTATRGTQFVLGDNGPVTYLLDQSGNPTAGAQ